MLPNLDKEYWNNRFQNNNIPWDIGYCSTPLKAYFDQLTNKDSKILIPGAGNAYEAEYLHQLGFTNIFVLDISEEAINRFTERCPFFPKQNILLTNFFDLTEQFDIIIEQTFFCALNPALRKGYVQKTFDLLKPQGKLVGVLFDKEFDFEGPPFGGKVTEYKDLFSKVYSTLSVTDCYNSIKPRTGTEVFIIAYK